MSTKLLSLSEKEQLIRNTWGHLPGFREDKPGRFVSGCPDCGEGRNMHRFFMLVDDGIVRGSCHTCGTLHKAGSSNIPSISPEELRSRERAWEARKNAEKRKRDALKSKNLKEKPWLYWHDSITPEGIEAWLREGITERMIDKYKLGYVKDRRFGSVEERFIRDAMTIPTWMYEWEVVSMQFRLINPPEDAGRYRPLYGMGQELFNAQPDRQIGKKIWLVEGAKKAMVVQEYLGLDWHVIAMPSINPKASLIPIINQASEIVICPDPNAFDGTKPNRPIDKLYLRLTGMITVMQMQVKPDDYLLLGGTKDSLLRKMERSVTGIRKPR